MGWRLAVDSRLIRLAAKTEKGPAALLLLLPHLPPVSHSLWSWHPEAPPWAAAACSIHRPSLAVPAGGPRTAPLL